MKWPKKKKIGTKKTHYWFFADEKAWVDVNFESQFILEVQQKFFIIQMTENKKFTLWKLKKVKIFFQFSSFNHFLPSFYSPPLQKKINGASAHIHELPYDK